MCSCGTRECFEFEMMVWAQSLTRTEMWWWREDIIKGLHRSKGRKVTDA